MHANTQDKNLVYTMMKKSRGSYSSIEATKLETPVGCYYGADILEGFTADAEFLGRAEGVCPGYDNDFYKMCIIDNFCTLEFKGENTVRIPHMTLADLEKILYSKMKAGKAPDIYHLTVEHLRNCGATARRCVLNLVNNILDEIYYVTCTQTKVGVSSIIYKG